MRREHGGHQAHPLHQNGEWLVVMEEEIRDLRGWAERNKPGLAFEADRLFRWVGCIYQFREVIDEGGVGGSQGIGQEA